MSNSRLWQRLCALPGETLSSPRPGKAIGSFESRTKDFFPSGPREGEKRGVFLCMERVPGSTGGILSWLFGRQDVNLRRPRDYFGKASCRFLICSTWMCFTSFSSSFVPFLPGCSQTSWWPCPQPWGTMSLCPRWQQSSWHRRVKLDAAFLFPTSLWSFSAGKPWLLQFPTLQLIHPFPEIPKCFVGSQNTCSELGSWRKVGRDVLPGVE